MFYLNGKDESLITINEEKPTQIPIPSPSIPIPSSPPPQQPIKEESTVLPRIQRAIELKDQGTEFFQKNDFESAASCYGQALTVLNVLIEDSFIDLLSISNSNSSNSFI